MRLKCLNSLLPILAVIVAAWSLSACTPPKAAGPVTVELQVDWLHDGKVVDQAIRTLSWKADGTYAHETRMLSRKFAPSWEIRDVRRDRFVAVDPLTRTVFEQKLSDLNPNFVKQGFAGDFYGKLPTERTKGSERMHGYEVERVVLNHGDVRIEWDVAPALNETALAKKVTSISTGQVVERWHALSVREGAEERLFNVPADYSRVDDRQEWLRIAKQARGEERGGQEQRP